jgi:lipoprotein-anchoring transpeptidase ErfK/SrfK
MFNPVEAGWGVRMRCSAVVALLLVNIVAGCGTVYTIIPHETLSYAGNHAPGTIVIKTGQRRLYLVKGGGKAVVYPIGVGEEGRSWTGISQVSAKREWPDWTPPDEMRARRPQLPAHMAGGPDNPMGARALYLGSSLYRIHGTNEPWTVGHAASSGCIRMYNNDVIELYEQTRIGATVIVQR